MLPLLFQEILKMALKMKITDQKSQLKPRSRVKVCTMFNRRIIKDRGKRRGKIGI